MPSLNVTQPDDWIERLGDKIDRKLAALAAGDPGWLERLAAQARQRAMHSLGLDELQAELDRLAVQKKQWQERQRRTYRAMVAVLRRVPLEEVEEFPSARQRRVVARAIAQRQAVHEAELLAAEERGQEILRWRREKDHLWDLVALASAPSPLKELWQKLVHQLGEELTPLENAVLAQGRREADG